MRPLATAKPVQPAVTLQQPQDHTLTSNSIGSATSQPQPSTPPPPQQSLPSHPLPQLGRPGQLGDPAASAAGLRGARAHVGAGVAQDAELPLGVHVQVSVPTDESEEGGEAGMAAAEPGAGAEGGLHALWIPPSSNTSGWPLAAGGPCQTHMASRDSASAASGRATVPAPAALPAPGTQAPWAPSALRLVRPLLCLSRLETANFCAGRGLHVWEDSTNADIHTARRNRVRIQVGTCQRGCEIWGPAATGRTGSCAEQWSRGPFASFSDGTC